MADSTSLIVYDPRTADPEVMAFSLGGLSLLLRHWVRGLPDDRRM